MFIMNTHFTYDSIAYLIFQAEKFFMQLHRNIEHNPHINFVKTYFDGDGIPGWIIHKQILFFWIKYTLQEEYNTRD